MIACGELDALERAGVLELRGEGEGRRRLRVKLDIIVAAWGSATSPRASRMLATAARGAITSGG